MKPLVEAQRFVLDSCAVASPVEMGREDATGLVLAAAVVSVEDVPPFANTAVDGYAVRAVDVADAPVEMTSSRRSPPATRRRAGSAPDGRCGS